MRKIFVITILTAFYLIPNLSSQVRIPNGINYQAVAREKNGKPLSNRELIVEILLINETSGSIIFNEEHRVITNKFGLFTLIIGQGLQATYSDNFSKIDWTQGSIKVVASIDFGSGLQQVGSTILQSVPYAIIADSALKAPRQNYQLKDLRDVNLTNIENNQVLSWNGSEWLPANVITSKEIHTNNIIVNDKIELKGKAYISDTLTVTGVFSSFGSFHELLVSGNSEFKKSLFVGENLIVSGNIRVVDTLKANYFKIEKIEGYLSGRVSDISNHSVTELLDVKDAGSGKIITDSERLLLYNLPQKNSKDSAMFERNLATVIKERKEVDSQLISNIGNEALLRYYSDSIIKVKISSDSLVFATKIKVRERFRDSVINDINNSISTNDTLINKLNSDLLYEANIRLASDSIISSNANNNQAKIDNKISQEIVSRSEADLILQDNIDKENRLQIANNDSLKLLLSTEQFERQISDSEIIHLFKQDSISIRQIIYQNRRLAENSDSMLNQLLNKKVTQINKTIDSTNQILKYESQLRYMSDSILNKKRILDSILVNDLLLAEVNNRKSSDSAVNDSIKAERQARLTDFNNVIDSVATESQLRKTATDKIYNKIVSDSLAFINIIDNEALNRSNSDNLINASILAETYSRDTASQHLRQEILDETLHRINSDEILSSRIVSDSAAVRTYINNTVLLNASLFDAISQSLNTEISIRTSSDKSILDSITFRTKERDGINSKIIQKQIDDSTFFKQTIDNEISNRITSDNNLASALNAEIITRNSNFSLVTDSLKKEKSERILNDYSLLSRVISDSISNINIHNLLNDQISNEKIVRENTDNELRHRITSNRSLVLDGTILSLNEASDTLSADLAAINTDNQAISYNESTHILTISNGGSVDLTSLLKDNDADSTNEFNRILNLNGNILEITDGGGTKSLDLSSVNTDNQNITYDAVTHILTLKNGGSIDLSGFLNSNVQLNGSNFQITDAGGTSIIDLSPVNTDNQTLSINSNKISISGGDTITIPYASSSQNGLLTLADWNRFNNKIGSELGSGQIWVGNAASIAMPVQVNGDATLTNSGQLVISNGAVSASKIINGAITADKLNSMGALTGQVLRYNGTKWQPSIDNSEFEAGTGISITGNVINNTAQDKTVTVSGSTGIGVSGTYPEFTITNTQPNINHSGEVTGSDILTISPNAVTTLKIADNAITGAKINPMSALAGQVLKYNGLTWVPAVDNNTTYNPGTGIGITGTTINNTAPDQEIVLNGNSGINISGTYPAFTITNSEPNAEHTGDVTGESALTISNSAVTTAKIADGSLTASKFNQMGATNGQVLKFNGTAWGPATDNAVVYTGSTGIEVTGSTITNTLPDQVVNVAGGVGISTSGTYPNFTITNLLPNVTHTGDVIGSDSLTIANNAITTPKLLDGAVTYTKLDRMGAEEGQVLKWKATRWVPAVAKDTEYVAGDGIKITGTIISNTKPNETHNGEVTGTRTLTITNSAVTTPKIRDTAVTTSKIAFKAIIEDKIDTGAVTNSRLGHASVSSEKIKNEAVTKEKISSNSIDSTRVATGSLSGSNLRDYTVTETKLGTSSVTAEKIKVKAVTTEKLDTGAVTTEKLHYAAVTKEKIATDAITTDKIKNGEVTLSKLSIDEVGVGDGKVIKFSGGKWAVGVDNNTFYTPGLGIEFNGNKIVNKSRDTIVTLNPGNGIGIKGLYPTFTISNLKPNIFHGGEVTGDSILTIQANAIVTDKIAEGQITSSKLNNMGAANGQILRYNGAWLPADEKSYTQGAGITITGTYPNYTITNNRIHDGDVAGSTTLTIGAGKVINSKIADDAISTDKVQNSAITDIKIATNAVTSTKISDASVITSKIGDQAVTSEKLAAEAVISAKLAGGSVISTKIYDGSVINSKLATSSVTSDKILDGTIGTIDISDGAIISGKLGADAVTDTKIAAGAITTAKIGDNAITTVKISNGAVTEDKIATGAITYTKIGDGAVTLSKLSGTGVSTGQIYKYTGSGWSLSNDLSDATSYNTANTIVKRNSGGGFSAGGITIGNDATAYNSNLNVYGAVNFYNKYDASSDPLSTITISQPNIDGSSDISPGIANTGHLGGSRKWYSVNSVHVNANNANISNINSNSTNATTLNIGTVAASYNGSVNIYGTFRISPGKDFSGNENAVIIQKGSDGYPEIIPSTDVRANLGNSSKYFRGVYTDYLYSNFPYHNSDRRIKENVSDLKGNLEKVLKLRGVKYDFTSEYLKSKDNEERKNKIGFIAQEVMEVLPELVRYDTISKLYGIMYDGLIPILTEAIKEQQVIIDSLKTSNNTQEARISELEKRLAEIERRLK